jgi:formate C-acetyltransferase|tara:strand:+ start:13737 stop:16037 length:2301 start_codon:yes stop_codon:yes gene_type:complete
MLQTVRNEVAERPSVGDGVMESEATLRIEKLKDALLKLRSTVTIDRARIETRILKENAGEPMVTRRAKAFAAIVREMPIDIDPDQLLVGYVDSGPYPAHVYPANAPMLAGSSRLNDEEKRELAEEIIPIWQEQGLMQPVGHYGHNIHNFEKVLSKGSLGIKEEAEAGLAELDLTEPEDLKKAAFLGGVVTSMEAAAEIGERFAALAREMAEEEKDATRKADLLKIAEVCERVPANPARTLHEALQACVFVRMLVMWEIAYDMGFCLGRMDQYLYPLFEGDMREGRSTREQAQELLDCYTLKVGHAGASASMAVGGVRPDGNDATNDLSYMFIEAIMHTRLAGPNFAVLVHSKSPDQFLIKACQLCSLGGGHPQFLNYDVMIAQALARGTTGGPSVTLRDARTAANVGCLELVIPGKDSGYLYFTHYSNHALALELVMTNGVRRSDGRQVGLQTGDSRQFTSFEEVQQAYHQQLAEMRRRIQIAGTQREQKLIELYPTLFESALIDDCIEKGMCREDGGAHYNFNVGITQLGTTDAADSLTAIKRLVFDDGAINMGQLCDALDSNFEGHDSIHRMCLEAPKFGNDDDYADEQEAWVLHEWVSEFSKMKNMRGGYCSPGGSSMSMYVPEGKVLGALPSGRLAGQPLADANSPSQGQALEGPTAILKSMGKADNTEILGGTPLNIRIMPGAFKDQEGVKRMADLVRVFVDQKIFHLQINVVSSDTLKEAQREPEKHGGLAVKVAGYNAFFTQLDKELQDTIIARTEHGL